MKKRWYDTKFVIRVLEILPGVVAWSIIITPIAAAPFFPVEVAYFVLVYNFYWFFKSVNIMRHMVNGFTRMWRAMKIDYLERCKMLSEDPASYLKYLKKRYQKSLRKLDLLDYQEVANLNGNYTMVKPWNEVYHAVFITNYQEGIDITGPTFESLKSANYPNDHIIIVSCGEARDSENYLKLKDELIKQYGDTFLDMQFLMHDVVPGEVIGKGSNLYSAGHKFIKYLNEKYPQIKPEDVIVTTLDGDHIVHKEYFSNVTYKYIIDPNRSNKTYQPIPLLFNNIWDAPSPSRVLAVASSFWLMIEEMRPHRLRTFASHSQSLSTLLVTDFWSNQTVVEDGHQYWRTYFAYNGDMEMTSIFIPIYHDTVLADTFWGTMVNQYKQRRRWAWGISDFPFVFRTYMSHPEISFFEKSIQTIRLFAGHVSWSTSSFILAFAWVPLLFDSRFQDTVLAHNVSVYSSNMLTLAWISVFANAWAYFMLLPPLPERHKKTRLIKYFGMVFQWFIAPVVSIFFSSLPALESQTRLMIGQSLNVFWTTPKIRLKD